MPLALHLTAPPTPTATATAPTASAPATAPTSSTPAPAPLVQLPARPASGAWVLRADRLVFRDTRFRGVVRVRTAAGTVRVLKFTARSLNALGLDVTTGRGRAALRMRARPASTSTLQGRGGDGMVTLYVRSLSGSLHGREITLTPDAVPDWLSPTVSPAAPATPARTLTFAGATMSTLAQFGGDLSLPGPEFRSTAG
ncbi:hypothetical protein ACGFYV_14625 [Streptomyces sp. NPDC048297]|uniref:hypothetical protein n=1 Tax=Streptomyces sp. NPDC048297 TaxID=3365531 RepID=UPI0037159C19